MKKTMIILAMALVMLLASNAMADSYYLDRSSLPADSQQTAEAAFAARLPQATLSFSILDRDDGRFEWEIFFTNGGALGVCEVDATTGVVIRVKEYTDLPAGALSADAAIEALKAAKGNLSVVELDLERDDGRLVYEGEAELDGRFYDFEMTVSGQIIEWERN